MHKLTVKDHADLRNDAVLLREDDDTGFDAITWETQIHHPGEWQPDLRHSHEPPSAPLWLDQVHTIQQQNNPGYVAGIDPGLRTYPTEPLGRHQSDDQPCPPYWDSPGRDRVNSEFNGLVWHIVGYVSASLLGIYLAMLWLNINPLDLF